jgi:hypothetical protein
MLNVIYAERRKKALYDECHYAECRYAECHGALCSIPVVDFMYRSLDVRDDLLR